MWKLTLNANHKIELSCTANAMGKPESLDFPSSKESKHLSLTISKNALMNSLSRGVIQRSAPAIVPVLLVLSVLIAAPLASAASQTQIILSCSIPPPFSHVPPNHCSSTPEGVTSGTIDYEIGGFWIWCQVGSGNSYGPDCSGSMYIEEVNMITGTAVYDTTSIRGSTSSFPQITFTTSDNDMTCTLTVVPGSSTLSGTCDGTPITFSNVIVRVT
jgi:hypothetical protein